MTVKTKRLVIRAASDDEMRAMINEEKDKDLKKAYGEMLDYCLRKPENRQWYAAWMILLPDGERIGDLCFKGLSDDGSVEIGYGLLEKYFGFGYATEAVHAMSEWALAQNGVSAIEAETDPCNTASQRVLEKCGFMPTGEIGEEGPRFVKKR